MTQQQAANLRSARILALSRASLAVNVDETPSLTFDQRRRYLAHLADIILAYPDRFDAGTVHSAQLAKGLNFGPLESYGIGDAFADFTSEFVRQGQAINPLSEQNRAKTAGVLTAVILAAAIVFFGILAIKTDPRRVAALTAVRKHK